MYKLTPSELNYRTSSNKRNSIFKWMGLPFLLGGRRAILGSAPSSGQAHSLREKKDSGLKTRRHFAVRPVTLTNLTKSKDTRHRRRLCRGACRVVFCKEDV
jgi:hypothetical protein